MIRYQPVISREELVQRINALDAGWLGRADARRDGFIAAGRFNEESSIWSDVKPVFMALQHNKCIFCERVFGGQLTGKSEHDVEHFRPKGRVLAWPYPSRKPKVAYDFSTGTPSGTGYYWLAYEIDNYACACKSCNSDRKRDYFPIAGTRAAAIADIATLNATEQPLLLFPHGRQGDDPASYITFDGVIAVPVPADGPDRRRARVTIEFFSLNDREELLADRARVIRSLFTALRVSLTETVEAIRAAAERDIEYLVSDASPQASCARAYLRLAHSDAQKAWTIYEGTSKYLK